MARRGGRAAIVATMRAPGADVLASWLAYHRAIGFRHFFIYFDDPDDPDRAAATGRDVTAVRCDPAFVRGLARLSQWSVVGRFVAGTGVDRLLARQILHVEDAMTRIEAGRMPIDWLLHIDADELFVVPGDDAGAHFAALDRLGTDQAIYLNHEAVPETLEVGDMFRTVTLFKRNPAVLHSAGKPRLALASKRRYLAYSHGKAAIRIGADAVPDGVHTFAGIGGALRTRWLASPYLLHYPSCGFARWRLKYQLLGDFPDEWMGRGAIRLQFHLHSRDVRAAPDDQVRAWYRRRAMLGGPAARELLRKRGVLVRIRGPARLLARVLRRRNS
jgi:hypothetical protein